MGSLLDDSSVGAESRRTGTGNGVGGVALNPGDTGRLVLNEMLDATCRNPNFFCDFSFPFGLVTLCGSGGGGGDMGGRESGLGGGFVLDGERAGITTVLFWGSDRGDGECDDGRTPATGLGVDPGLCGGNVCCCDCPAEDVDDRGLSDSRCNLLLSSSLTRLLRSDASAALEKPENERERGRGVPAFGKKLARGITPP